VRSRAANSLAGKPPAPTGQDYLGKEYIDARDAQGDGGHSPVKTVATTAGARPASPAPTAKPGAKSDAKPATSRAQTRPSPAPGIRIHQTRSSKAVVLAALRFVVGAGRGRAAPGCLPFAAKGGCPVQPQPGGRLPRESCWSPGGPAKEGAAPRRGSGSGDRGPPSQTESCRSPRAEIPLAVALTLTMTWWLSTSRLDCPLTRCGPAKGRARRVRWWLAFPMRGRLARSQGRRAGPAIGSRHTWRAGGRAPPRGLARPAQRTRGAGLRETYLAEVGGLLSRCGAG